MKIVLLGYMASGKSAVGKALSKKLNMDFIDLDAYIETKESASISEIFASKGEIYFRKVEGLYLNELLDTADNFILSLGGGTPCYGSNMQQILSKSESYYLKASINTIFERLKNETSERPLVATIGTEKLPEYIAKHLFERAPFYEQASKIIPVDTKDIAEIVLEIKAN